MDSSKLPFQVGDSAFFVRQLLVKIDGIGDENLQHLRQVVLDIADQRNLVLDNDHCLPDLARHVTFKLSWFDYSLVESII